MTTVTAPALRRSMLPTARARTAATASSAAVPATTRSSVSNGGGFRKLPLWRRIRPPSGTTTAAAARPATKVTKPITIAFAARTRPRRGLAARVMRIRPRRYSAVMNIVATTISAISPPKAPVRVSSMGVAMLVSGAMSPDPAGRGPRWAELGAELGAAPPTAGLGALEADLVEGGRGHSGAAGRAAPTEMLGLHGVIGGGGKQPGLDGCGQPG